MLIKQIRIFLVSTRRKKRQVPFLGTFFHQALLVSLSVEEYNQEVLSVVLTEGGLPLPVAQRWERTWEAQLYKSVGLLQCLGVSAESFGRCMIWKSRAEQCFAGNPKSAPG